MDKPGTIIVTASLIASFIFLGFHACTIRETDYPDRVKFKRAYKTVKVKRYICSKCHTDPHEAFMERLEP